MTVCLIEIDHGRGEKLYKLINENKIRDFSLGYIYSFKVISKFENVEGYFGGAKLYYD